MIKIIDVKFKPNTAGTPGTWTLPPPVTVKAGHPSVFEYHLDTHGTEGWFFDRIAIGENSPEVTDFIESSPENNSEMQFGPLVVRAAFSTERDRIEVTVDGIPTERITIGVLLTVTNGNERHTCRDPQITLDRDPEMTPVTS